MRKDRAAKPTLADNFFEWLDRKVTEEDWVGFGRTLDPVGNWQVDAFVQFLRDEYAGSHAKIRREVSGCLYSAVWRAMEQYTRRQEAERHRQRASEARELAGALRHFLAGRAADLSALGWRDDRNFHAPQIAADRELQAEEEWRVMEEVIPDLSGLLERFASDRDHLDLPPRDRTDIFGMIFVGNIQAIATKLFGHVSEIDVHRFALAAWRDGGLPLPDRDQGSEPEAWLDWMTKKFVAWKKIAPEKKGAIGFSQQG